MKKAVTVLSLAALASAAYAAAEIADTPRPTVMCIPPAVAQVLS